MGITLDYPQKFENFGQVYSHLYHLTETLNNQLNNIPMDSLSPDVKGNIGRIDSVRQNSQEEEQRIKSQIAKADKNTASLTKAISETATLADETATLVDRIKNDIKRVAPIDLLINSYFIAPVNQRGHTTYTGQGYTIDRWTGVNAATQINLTTNGMELYHAGTSGYAVIQQFIAPEYDQKYRNQTLTLSLCMADGTIHIGRGVPSEGTIYAGSARLDIATSKDRMRVYLQHNEVGKSRTFRWVAVYPGEYTAETLPEYTPRGYAAELLECQRYYVRCKIYHLAGQMLTTGGRFALTLPTEMRVTPTLTLLNAGTVVCKGVENVAVTDATLQSANGNRISIYTKHDTQSGWARHVGVWISGEIGLSADL